MPAGSTEAKIASKDEQIALLMQEGEALSKTELRHLQTIKKLRAKAAEDEKASNDIRKKLERAERGESELEGRRGWRDRCRDQGSVRRGHGALRTT